MAGLPVSEYAPRAIKQAVAGSGAADKLQIQRMITLLLNLPESPQAVPPMLWQWRFATVTPGRRSIVWAESRHSAGGGADWPSARVAGLEAAALSADRCAWRWLRTGSLVNHVPDPAELGADVTLHTHLVVREDAHTLYGFASTAERSLFQAPDPGHWHRATAGAADSVGDECRGVWPLRAR